MIKFLSLISLIFIFTFSTSCSKDNDDLIDSSVVGTWELTTWTLAVPINLNNDTTSSMNLLDEALCENNETLIFGTNGTVFSNMTYNPQVTISLTNGTTDHYNFDVICDMEGSIGTAGEYTQNANSVMLFDTMAEVNGNQLTLVYLDAINIYNEEISEVVETKDLILVYTKK